MKILFITNHLNGTDGWSRYSLDLAREYVRRQIDVSCVVSEASVSNAGIKEHVLLSDPISYVANTRLAQESAGKLQSLITEFKPDVIHVIVEPYQALLPWVTIPAHTKVVATIHGTYSYIPALFQNPVKKLQTVITYWKALKKIDAVIAVSSYTRDRLKRHLVARMSGTLDKVKVIENAIDLQSIVPLEQSLKSVDGKKHILFVGTNKPRKGLHLLIPAIKEYVSTLSKNVVLDIVGSKDSGGYTDRLKEMVKEFGIEEQVKFHGRVSESDLNKLYGAAQAFVLLAIPDQQTFEGFGLVYLEANARGIPVIGTRDSGARDAIKQGKTGFLVNNPENYVETAGYLVNILDEHAIQSEDCIEWARHHDVKLAADRILKIYHTS